LADDFFEAREDAPLEEDAADDVDEEDEGGLADEVK